MTRERAAYLAPLIKAYAEGATIQCQTHESIPWQDIEEPTFLSTHLKYRIKPKEN